MYSLAQIKLLAWLAMAATVLLTVSTVAHAQFDVEDGIAVPDIRPLTRDHRPTWSVIPTVRSPSFGYREVLSAQMIAEASESLNYLPTEELIIGNTRGYQVIGPDGETFFLSNINDPKCAVRIEGTRIVVEDGSALLGRPLPGQNTVVIGEINFEACR